MQLSQIVENIINAEIPERFAQCDIKAICVDSRKVSQDSLFVAMKGQLSNGEDFIEEAIQKGAKVIIKSAGASKASVSSSNDVCVIEVPNVPEVLSEITRMFFGNPSETVDVIGITGTNGKTTVAYLVESILEQAQQSCGVMGTINYRMGDHIIPAVNTTPGLIENQQFLSDLRKQKVKYCVMEVSSHALEQERVSLINFQTSVFTNLASDHLDYHQNREAYFLSKSKLFTALSPEAKAVINNDDPFGQRLRKMTKAEILTYGLKNKADFMAKEIEANLLGSAFKLQCPNETINVQTRLIGEHNIANILAAAAACYASGIKVEDIVSGINALHSIPGRLERVECSQDFCVFVDYAHTEDGLKNVLQALKNVSTSRIILVFGCGGDRDKTKRPKMGEVADELADAVILTSDNPRNENPDEIIKQIVEGFKTDSYKIEPDRKKAIQQAIQMAEKDDIVLVAGKGHEDYQTFKDRTIHFDDREVLREIFNMEVKK